MRNHTAHNGLDASEEDAFAQGVAETYVRWYLYYIAELEQRLAALTSNTSP